MVKFVQLVMGPAGVGMLSFLVFIHRLIVSTSGKSTYCKILQDHCKASHRMLHVANLDPACDFFNYDAAFDIRDLINLEEVMEDLGYGPNGGLVYCMEYLLSNLDWLKEELDNFGDDEYVLLDLPGQVELYSHLSIMHNIAKSLTLWGYRALSVYLIDALFVLEPSKFISGCMLSLSCMLQLELPHINIITKCDMADKEQINTILESEGAWIVNTMDSLSSGKLKKLTQALSSVIDDYMIVSFAQLDPTDEDSIEDIMLRTDMTIQYGEDIEPKEPIDDYDAADNIN